MAIKVYRDNDANAVVIEPDASGAIGMRFDNELRAIGNGDGTCSILNPPKSTDDDDFAEIAGVSFTLFTDEEGTALGVDEASTCNALNSILRRTGSVSQTELPVITSPLTISSVQGNSINYELTADYGVGYEWDLTNVPGVTTVEGNERKLIGGAELSSGTYNIPVKAINYNGHDSETIVLTVDTPPFSNTKSANFNNNDYLGANAALLDGVLGRASNGAGSGDAWSISFYFKPGTASNASQTIFYFGGQDVANEGYLQLKYNGSLNRFEVRYGSNNNRLNLVTATSTSPQGVWAHYLVTYDGGTTGASSGSLADYYGRFNIYIDGALQSTTNSHSNYGYTGSVSGTNLRVGRWNNGQSLRNNCRVDELAVWGSDQASNVAAIYNSGTPHDLSELGTPPDHWWRMGDGDTYPTIQDNVGSAHFIMYNMTAADIINDVP